MNNNYIFGKLNKLAFRMLSSDLGQAHGITVENSPENGHFLILFLDKNRTLPPFSRVGALDRIYLRNGTRYEKSDSIFVNFDKFYRSKVVFDFYYGHYFSAKNSPQNGLFLTNIALLPPLAAQRLW